MLGYRIILPTTALLREGSREYIGTLGRDAIVIPTSVADRGGLVEATHDGRWIRVFERDLLERSERVDLKEISRIAT